METGDHGAGGDNAGEGIQFTGSGNVIRHNRVSGFRDCISHMEDDGAGPQSCNDILNNDLDAASTMASRRISPSTTAGDAQPAHQLFRWDLSQPGLGVRTISCGT